MPAYELTLLLRNMAKPELMQAIQRTAESILDKGGILRKMESLGSRKLPTRIRQHEMTHTYGSYFVIHFDSPINAVPNLKEECARDVDIVRRMVVRKNPPDSFECTLEEELQPPAYRPSVQKMIAEGRKKKKYEWKPNTGLDFYPFQK